MRCQICHFDNDSGARFCGNCGAAMQVNSYPGATNAGTTSPYINCPNCGVANMPDSLFCESCGTQMARQAVSSVSSVSDGDSQVTTQTSANKTSAAWWLLPILLTWVGGLIAWLVIREDDKAKARSLLILGIVMTFVWMAVGIVIGLLGTVISPGFF